MKYKIETLLKEDNIKCHEIRATRYKGQHFLLHFFITQPIIADSLPRFKMGYEKYDMTEEDLEAHDNKPLESSIKTFGLLNITHANDSIFDFEDSNTMENEWTVQQNEYFETDENSFLIQDQDFIHDSHEELLFVEEAESILESTEEIEHSPT